MGYYARGSGGITFCKELKETDVKHISDLLSGECFEFFFYSEQKKNGSTNPHGPIGVDFWFDDKYHGENVENMLAEIAKVAEIKEGEIRYIGEDESLWRFRYVQNGGWVEENGRVVYD